jgi:DNA polymerase III epsilon subunit family exonuclease
MSTAALREIVLDTETTGLDPLNGHRIVEIGCLELVNHIPTARHFHRYVNPECDIAAEAVAVHGLTREKLSDKPVFAEIAADFLDFIGDARLVIHNADFDVGFINAELGRLGLPPMPADRALCTVKLARRRFPGSPASLDALCRRCSTPSCWPNAMSNCWAAGSRVWRWRWKQFQSRAPPMEGWSGGARARTRRATRNWPPTPRCWRV